MSYKFLDRAALKHAVDLWTTNEQSAKKKQSKKKQSKKKKTIKKSKSGNKKSTRRRRMEGNGPDTARHIYDLNKISYEKHNIRQQEKVNIARRENDRLGQSDYLVQRQQTKSLPIKIPIKIP